MVNWNKSHHGVIEGVECRSYGKVKCQADLETETRGAPEIWMDKVRDHMHAVLPQVLLPSM